MPLRTSSYRPRVFLRLAAFALIAVGLANCADSARFSSEEYVRRPSPPVQTVAPVASPPSSYRSVTSEPLPAPNQYTGPSSHYSSSPSYRTDYGTARPADRMAQAGRPGEASYRTAHRTVRRTEMSMATPAPAANMKTHAKNHVGMQDNGRSKTPASQKPAAPARSALVAQPKPAAPVNAENRNSSTQPRMASASAQNIRLAVQEPKKTETVLSKTESAGALPTFRWPVRGRIISGFGSNSNGTRNDGINVAVPEGTPVKAAEDGVVAYAGNELKGYGNLVLIRHANGYVSAYANASELLVKRGETVKRGQVIAHAGQTGNVNSPQLHFEIRKGKTPVDPSKHLSGG